MGCLKNTLFWTQLGLKGQFDARKSPRRVLESSHILGEMDKLCVAAGWEHSALVVPSQEFFPSIASRLSLGGDLNACLAQFVNTIVLLGMIPSERVIGATLTVICGNLAFGYMAKTKGATALPHGLNAVALFALRTASEEILVASGGDAAKATRAAIFCTFALGLIQIPCALTVAPFLKRHVPRAALMATVAGVACSFILTNFAKNIFIDPRSGLPALAVFLIGFGARSDMPWGVPVAFIALTVGHLLSSPMSSRLDVTGSLDKSQFGGLWTSLFEQDNYPLLVSVVLPLTVVNLISNLACVEAARAAGDDFDGPSALLVDSVATLLGAVVFGSPTPTCIYVGHAGFKSMGATFRFSWANAFLLILLVTHFAPLVALIQEVPLASAIGVLVWVGAVVTSEGFKAKRHGPAVAIAIAPALAAWKGDTGPFGARGYMLVSLLLGSSVTHLLDHKYFLASSWFAIACVLSQLGLIHASDLVAKTQIAQGYFGCSMVCLFWGMLNRYRSDAADAAGGEYGEADDGGESEARELTEGLDVTVREGKRPSYGAV